jgi:hypothetical protein
MADHYIDWFPDCLIIWDVAGHDRFHIFRFRPDGCEFIKPVAATRWSVVVLFGGIKRAVMVPLVARDRSHDPE